MSNRIKTQNANLNSQCNVMSVRHSRAYETSQHVRTRHVRHISCPMTKLTENYSSHANNLLNVIIQSHSCCNQNRTHWIVATINPIPCRPCVHPSTFPKVQIDKFCGSKCRDIIIFAHNYFRKTNTNQVSHQLDIDLSIFFF